MTETRSTSQLPPQELGTPPGRTVTCYITAKRIHANMLLDLRKDWPTIHFTAKWPVVRDLSFEQNKPARFWLRDNVDDISRSEVVVCYAEPTDQLNGSIWELGVAWTLGKPILLVGQNDGYKEWQHAQNIRRVGSLAQALKEVADRGRYDQSDASRLMGAISHLGERVHKHLADLEERLKK